jgi:PAT family beta-lactamase induction signal transducer AmpG
LVDAVRGPRWTLREWILSMQILMGVTLLPLAFLDFAGSFWIIRASLLLHALAASLQDAAIDSFAITSVNPGERGSLNGWMQTGYLTGRALFGGTILVVSGFLDGSASVLLLCGALWTIALVVALFIRPVERASPRAGVRATFGSYRRHLASAAKSKKVWLGLLFAGVSGAAFEGVGAVGGPFLIDRGLSQGDVGWFFSLPAVGGMIAGSLAGGFGADRFGTARMVRAATLFVAANTMLIALMEASASPVSNSWMISAFFTLYVGIGLFTASTYAMFMNLTDPALGATQFSAYMGATNGCEAWSGFLTGRLSGAWGFPTAFVIMAIVSTISVVMVGPLHGSDAADGTAGIPENGLP